MGTHRQTGMDVQIPMVMAIQIQTQAEPMVRFGQ